MVFLASSVGSSVIGNDSVGGTLLRLYRSIQVYASSTYLKVLLSQNRSVTIQGGVPPFGQRFPIRVVLVFPVVTQISQTAAPPS